MNASIRLAVATLSLALVGSVSAQYRVDNARMNDASNRVGSGGYNGNIPTAARTQLGGNDLVTGNVTGGRQFRGPIGYTDPRAFRGVTSGGNSDSFIRDSSGVTTSGIGSLNAVRDRPFYGDARAVPPPPNFSRIPGTGGNLPTRPVTSFIGDARRDFGVDISDVVSVASQTGVQNIRQNTASGQNDASLESYDRFYGQNINALSDYTQLSRRVGQVSDSQEQFDFLRNQINGSANTSLISPNVQRGGGAATDTTQTIDESPTNRNVQPGVGEGLPDRGAPGDQVEGNPQAGNAQPGNAQLQTMRERLQAFEPRTARAGTVITPGVIKRPDAKPPESDPANPALPGANDGKGERPANPSGIVLPNADGVDPKTNQRPRAEPVKVRDFSSNIGNAKAAEALRKAESFMKDGKFSSAIDEFDNAERLLPREPTIYMGRAVAELGAGFYRRAEISLRSAFAREPALMMGEYDLRGLIGDDRLQYVFNELAQIQQNEPKQPGALIMLAFVSYNTGDARRAAAYLELADQRAGRKDDFIQQLRSHWSLDEKNEPMK